MTTSLPANAVNWNALIEDIVAGRWIDPETGKRLTVPYRSIVIAESLEGREADLVAALGMGQRLAVVYDSDTRAAMGDRVERALASRFDVRGVLLDHPHADEDCLGQLASLTRDVDALVAVGSGTLNDLCKYVTFKDGRQYCVFGTAPSMNGYTSTTASITLRSGLKVSLPSHAPQGFFVDLTVNAAAPPYLAAAGFGDCLCRSTAQVDWWMAHRLYGSSYTPTPFVMQEADEVQLLARASDLPRGDKAAVAYLYRVLTECGLGVSLTGTSHHGSGGEHQISHYIDCFAGDAHPGTRHGQQVGVATLTMARLQQDFLARPEPPVIHPTRIDEGELVRRFGPDIAAQCLEQFRKKALDEAGAAAVNQRLRQIWPDLRRECQAFMLPIDRMTQALRDAGGAVTAKELGIAPDFYRDAVVYSRAMRNRFSVVDLLDDAGLLRDAAAALDLG